MCDNGTELIPNLYTIETVEEMRVAPFYDPERKKYIPAKDLKVGDSLLLSDGERAKISCIEIERLKVPETTYTLEVEDFHTYFVSESAVLVHNKCAYAYLDEALKRQGLDRVPGGGLKEVWIENGYKIEVRVHAGNPQYTMVKQIFRVSRQVYPANNTGWEYLGSDGIWYHLSRLKPTSAYFNPIAAKLTHIPVP